MDLRAEASHLLARSRILGQLAPPVIARAGLRMPEYASADARWQLFSGPDPRNTFTGSHCADFGNYMATTGVYDTSGSNHPGWAGATEFFPTVGRFKVTPTSTSQNVWECPCAPGVYYDSQSACEAAPPCRPGLGGCLEKCGGFAGVCLSAKVKLPITGPAKVSLLHWQPPSVSASCAAAISSFDAAVLVHENHHQADAAKILTAAQKSANRTFKACGKTPQDARTRLNQVIRDAVKSQVDQMSQAYTDSVSAFHSTPAGQPVLMNCSAC